MRAELRIKLTQETVTSREIKGFQNKVYLMLLNV